MNSSLRIWMLGLYVTVKVHLGSKGVFIIKTVKRTTGYLVNPEDLLGAKYLSTLNALTVEWIPTYLFVILKVFIS